MTPFTSLLLPIVLSAVGVFLLSSIIHMAMPWHKGDYVRVPDEDRVADALRPFNIPPGDYGMPNPMTEAGGRNPDFMAQMSRGPVVVMTVVQPGPFSMGRSITTWFLFCLLVSAIAGAMAGTVVAPGGNDHAIFHQAGMVSFLSFTLGAWPLSIWYHRKWSTALKGTFDGLLYGVATGLIFTWMWPKL